MQRRECRITIASCRRLNESPITGPGSIAGCVAIALVHIFVIVGLLALIAPLRRPVLVLLGVLILSTAALARFILIAIPVCTLIAALPLVSVVVLRHECVLVVD
jgi:hypothetical protein